MTPCAIRRYAFFLLIILILFAAISCNGGGDDDDDHAGPADDDDNDASPGDDDDDDNNNNDNDNDDTTGDFEELILQGKQFLAAGQYGPAYLAFDAALAIDADHPDALFGMILAQTQHLVGILDLAFGFLLLDYVDDGIPEENPPTAAGLTADDDADDEYLDGLVGNLTTAVLTNTEELGARLETLKSDENFQFDLEAYPLKFGGAAFFNLFGEWDRADLDMLDAFYQALRGLILLLDSQTFAGSEDEIMNVVDGDILTGITTLLYNNPGLLALDAEDGDVQWNASRQAFRGMATSVLAAVERMAAETDDQSDDVFAQNDNLTVDGVRHLALQGEFFSGENRVLILWDGPTYSLQETLSRLIDNIDGADDSRLRFEQDILAPVAVAVDFLRRGVGLEEILALVELELPGFIIDILNNVGTRNGEQLPKVLINVLLPLLGVPTEGLQLDPGTFYSRPLGLRDLLPNIGPEPFAETISFLASYECARLGFATAELTVGDDLAVLLHDRGPVADANAGPGNDSLVVTLRTLDAGKAVLDEETLTIDEDADVEALFAGALATAAGGATIGDGTLQIPAGASIAAVYTDANGAPLEVSAAFDDDLTTDDLFAYLNGCQTGTARDYAHFEQAEFAGAILYPAPPAPLTPGAYPVIAADGIAAAGPYLAFQSPSLNGLVWLDMNEWHDDPAGYGFPTGYAQADERSINVFVQRIVELIESF